jgi:hypothetical protein
VTRIIILFFLFLFSCSESYEVQIEPETNDQITSQKYHLNFNGKITYPTGKVTKSFDPDKDQFEVIKIKYVPLKKWRKNNLSDNEWGQAGIRVRVIRKSDIFTSEEVILDRTIYRFYNPGIENFTTEQRNAVRQFNPDLDSGLGNGTLNNSPYYGDYQNPIFSKAYLENNPANFYHSLILKTSPEVLGDINFKATSNDATKLPVDDLSRCVIIYPHNSARLLELKQF